MVMDIQHKGPRLCFSPGFDFTANSYAFVLVINSLRPSDACMCR